MSNPYITEIKKLQAQVDALRNELATVVRLPDKSLPVSFMELSVMPQSSALQAMLFNSGAREIGPVESEVIFNPLLHEDTIGGLWPEDKVMVIRVGWKYGGKVIIRAQVK